MFGNLDGGMDRDIYIYIILSSQWLVVVFFAVGCGYCISGQIRLFDLIDRKYINGMSSERATENRLFVLLVNPPFEESGPWQGTRFCKPQKTDFDLWLQSLKHRVLFKAS
jgi:hypothetical protein